MSGSRLFAKGFHKEIEQGITQLINSQPGFLTPRTTESTRATGDAIQAILSDTFPSLLGTFCAEYSADFARRAMADLAFRDQEGFYYLVDVKTHRIGTAFSMPNLTSVERLARFYEDGKNYFVVLLVDYELHGERVEVIRSHFVPIEFLAWDCLTVGALGWGQVQIANANLITINEQYPRKRWMLELCDAMLEFYPAEIGKIKERIKYFEDLRVRWEKQPD